MTPVIAVADYAGRQARLAACLAAAFPAAGLALEFRTHRELAAEVSVEQSPGQPPAVTPDRPLLWLSPGDTGWPSTAGGRSGSPPTAGGRRRLPPTAGGRSGFPATPDGRFLAAETLAAARSIAFLTRSPVLNRPSAVSLCGALPPASARAVRGARHLDPEAVRAERFVGTWPPDAAGDGRLEVYDYATGRGSYGLAAAPGGPFRYRADRHPARRVKVLVAGDLTIAAADVAPATLDVSRRVAAWYQLDLATVWWLAGPGDGARTLARIDGWEWGSGDHVTDVAAAVAAWMTGRLARPAAVSP